MFFGLLRSLGPPVAKNKLPLGLVNLVYLLYAYENYSGFCHLVFMSLVGYEHYYDVPNSLITEKHKHK